MDSPTQSRRRRSAWIRRAETACLGVGFLLLAAWAVGQTHAAVGRWSAVNAFRVAQAKVIAEPAADTTLWAAGRIDAYNSSLAAEIRPPEGLLRIASIGLTVPIFDGTAELNLNRGVGRIEGTAALGQRGNLGIAGHRDGFFRGLKDVEIGDAIEVRTLDETFTYRIADITIVEPTDVGVLDDTSESILTLVTCYPFYFIGHAPQRYIVQAVSVDHESI